MGNQQTKYSGLRFSFLVLLLSFAFLLMGYGYCLLGIQENLQSSPKHVNAQATKDLYWGKDIMQDNLTRSDKAFHVNTAGGLAYLNYLFSRSAHTSVEDSPEDYSNYTIYLTSNIELNNVPLNLNGEVRNIDPLWIPFEIGKSGKHRNITFDGAGFTISGLHIKYEITDGQEPRNIGFFSEMYGGVFKNVTFKNPVIEYEYVGNSLAKDDPARPDAPIEVGVGVIAGCADSTYIENVKIENPSITVTTKNSNGHNFYVGSAVGKMNFTSKIVGEGDDKKQESINTVTPTQWGINTVNVVKTDTKSTGLNFTIALNYGSRDEILRGVQKIAQEVKDGKLDVADISEDMISNHLDTAGIPDPDLLIRTSGEERLSNYLLWQLAYTEFYFTDVLWPDFDRNELIEAIKKYSKRERRFGKTS